ncbi:hypothetical protein GYMLUDRAFT_246541 [Collybiopsis luxurians FD-317 M1]|uniref:Uncharacterized protein n=1 Tax=Collybiopsis luxurians FD-317 M1 TaxID=944289 RepID=A0A0D0C5S8_9AGAR|nr:hypothetical protein GYMLUDRAFT_246541 [Collybiopsis luxurians FD-317 M1]
MVGHDSNEQLQELIRCIPKHLLLRFCDQYYSTEFIENNPAKFLGFNWVDFDVLSDYLCNEGHESLLTKDLSTESPIKQEDADIDISLMVTSSAAVQMHVDTDQNGNELIYIYNSDEASEGEDGVQDGNGSNDNEEMKQESIDAEEISSVGDTNDTRNIKILSVSGQESEGEEVEKLVASGVGVMDVEWKKSNTVWLNEGIWSEVFEGKTKLNQQLSVQQLEKVHSRTPSNWPINPTPTAFLINLSNLGKEEVDLEKLLNSKVHLHNFLNIQ